MPLRLVVAVSIAFAACSSAGDQVVLKDGMTFSGELDLKDERVEVTERHRVVSISRALLLNAEQGGDEKPPISFHLPQPVPKKPPKPLVPLVGFAKVEPFDEFGRRAVVLVNEAGRQSNQIQAIHALYPTHVETDVIEGSFRSTSSLAVLSGPTLRKILRRCIDPKKEQMRVRLIEFLLQAGRFEEASQEIAEFKQDGFGAENVDTLTNKLARRLADFLIARLERAAAVDDVQRCREIAPEALKQASPEQRAKIEAIVQRVEKLTADVSTARRIVENSMPAVAAHSRSADLTDGAKAIVNQLSPSTLERLRPMLFLAERSDAKPEDRLAVALSGWCAGAALAQPDLDRAADLWRAREHLVAAIQGDEVAFQDRLRRLSAPIVDGRPKLGADILAEMISLLSAPPADRAVDSVSQVKRNGGRSQPVEYLIYLPAAYSPNRRWPTVVALHDQNADPQKEIGAWRGSASDYGVIVCCPVWRKDERTNWGYGVEDHVRLEETLVDLRRRFAVDPDRLFLAGRGAGGDAAWDFAAGHADEFAGLISLSGLPQKYAERCTVNFTTLPILSIHGGLNMQRASAMNNEFTKLCAKKCEAVHIVYPARGGESFATDVPMFFDWMSRRQRTPFPKKIGAMAARETDHRFYWAEIDEMREGALTPPEFLNRNRFNPAMLNGIVTDAGTVQLRTNNISSVSVLLSPKLAALDAPGFAVRVNNRVVFKGPVEPDLETMLRRLRATGDSSRLIAKVVSVKRP